jgi:hypothetical protein
MQLRQPLLRLALAGAAAAALPASASALELDLKGSLGEAGFTHYVAPVSSPTFNETPYITTEARPFYAHHAIPDDFMGGGDVDVIAIQLRAAITQRLGFIATKDGWMDIDWDSNPKGRTVGAPLDLQSDSGFLNLAFGFKYAALAIAESNTLLTVGARYEAPTGGLKTRVNQAPALGRVRLQGQGDGLMDLFVTGARTFGGLGAQASIGTQLACDTDVDTSFLHWSIHLDYDVMQRFFPLVEFNGYTPIIDGDRRFLDGSPAALGANGMDVLNLGSPNADTVVTFATGLRVKILDNVDFGGTFEVPVTRHQDITDWRTTTDFVIHL